MHEAPIQIFASTDNIKSYSHKPTTTLQNFGADVCQMNVASFVKFAIQGGRAQCVCNNFSASVGFWDIGLKYAHPMIRWSSYIGRPCHINTPSTRDCCFWRDCCSKIDAPAVSGCKTRKLCRNLNSVIGNVIYTLSAFRESKHHVSTVCMELCTIIWNLERSSGHVAIQGTF